MHNPIIYAVWLMNLLHVHFTIYHFDVMDICGSSEIVIPPEVLEFLSIKTPVTTKQEELDTTEQVSAKTDASDFNLVPYSTELQRRKKAELRTLRTKVREMEIVLNQLKQTHRENIEIAASRSDSSRWRSVAAISSCERQRAEQRNRELKAILANQIKVRAALAKLLGQKRVQEEMNFVFQSPRPTIDRPLLESSGEVLEAMAETLAHLHREMGTVLPVLQSDVMVSFRCEFVSKSDRGRGMQISAITPLACSAHQAGNWILGYAAEDHKEMGRDISFNHTQKKLVYPLDMYSVSTLRVGLQIVNTVSTFRRYEDENDQVFIGTTKWFLPDGRLLLQDYNWTVISPSPIDLQHTCVLRNCYKLELASKELEAQEEMRMLDLKMRNAIQSTQDAFLTRMGLGTH